MLVFLKFLYITFLLPPGIIIIALAVLSYQLSKKRQKCAWMIGTITLALYLVSTSVVGSSLIRSLESRYQAPDKLSGDVIIVLGAGAFDNGLSNSSASRLLTGVQLYHQLHVPIILSGGRVYSSGGDEVEIQKDILIKLGVPEDKIILDKNSFNTTLSGVNCKEIFNNKSFNKGVLVTSAFHMERSVRQFEKYDLNVVPYPTDYFSNKNQSYSFENFWPNASALETCSLAIKEWIGILATKWY